MSVYSWLDISKVLLAEGPKRSLVAALWVYQGMEENEKMVVCMDSHGLVNLAKEK